MVAGAEVIHQSLQMIDVKYRCIAKEGEEAAVVDIVSPSACHVAVDVAAAASELDLRNSDAIPDVSVETAILKFMPSIRSGSFSDIGPRRYMEDEHICIDDLSAHLGSLIQCPTPSAFYGIFDGHGGPDAAAFIKRHAIRFLFQDVDFPQASDVDKVFLDSVENSVQKAFLVADLALADDCTISTSSGTTALAVLVFGRVLLVANAGDCRAVLCHKGKAIEMSQDHRPIYPPERQRVESSGGYIDDGYLNGVLSVSRALGDWDMKLPRGAASPLIAEPEFKQAILTEDDEFLIIGCDGIWDVMSSQDAVSIVRRGLRRHDNPEQCARDLVVEALRLSTSDNLTVIVVCFSLESKDERVMEQQRAPRSKCCNLSTGALCNLKSWLEKH